MSSERLVLQPGPPGQPLQSRPLRTGKSFVLVVPTVRAIAARWDKVDYEPGEECELTLAGVGLGTSSLVFTVEAEAEDGSWVQVAKLDAPIADDGKKALASWKLPRQAVEPGAASLRETDGSVLSDPRFEDTQDLEREGPVWLRAQAAGFEGKSLQVVLEVESAPGEWAVAGEAVATVRSGEIRAGITPQHDD